MCLLSLRRPPALDLRHPGSSESGKSTIVKQMRIIHQDGFSYDTKLTYREAIYSNLLESAQAVATAMHKFKVEPADPSNVVSSSSDLGSLVSSLILFHAVDAGAIARIRSRCRTAVVVTFIPLCLPQRTCGNHPSSLEGPSGPRVC